jgi:hypothetical protein
MPFESNLEFFQKLGILSIHKSEVAQLQSKKKVP